MNEEFLKYIHGQLYSDVDYERFKNDFVGNDEFIKHTFDKLGYGKKGVTIDKFKQDLGFTETKKPLLTAPGFSPIQNALLDAVADVESPGFDVIVGGKKFTDFSKHPNIVGVVTEYGPSTAAGGYQMTYSTWKNVQKVLDLPDFGPDSQKIAALYLMQDDYGRRTKGRNIYADLENGMAEYVREILAGTGAATTFQGLQKDKTFEQRFNKYVEKYKNSPGQRMVAYGPPRSEEDVKMMEATRALPERETGWGVKPVTQRKTKETETQKKPSGETVIRDEDLLSPIEEKAPESALKIAPQSRFTPTQFYDPFSTLTREEESDIPMVLTPKGRDEYIKKEVLDLRTSAYDLRETESNLKKLQTERDVLKANKGKKNVAYVNDIWTAAQYGVKPEIAKTDDAVYTTSTDIDWGKGTADVKIDRKEVDPVVEIQKKIDNEEKDLVRKKANLLRDNRDDLTSYIRDYVYEDFNGTVRGKGGDERAAAETLIEGSEAVKNDIQYIVDYNTRQLAKKYPEFDEYIEDSKLLSDTSTDEQIQQFNTKYKDILSDSLTKEIWDFEDIFNNSKKIKNQVESDLLKDPEYKELFEAKQKAKNNRDLTSTGGLGGFSPLYDVIGKNASRLIGRTVQMAGGITALFDTEIGGKIIRYGEDVVEVNPKSSKYEGLPEEYVSKVGNFEVVYESKDAKTPSYVRDANTGFMVEPMFGLESLSVENEKGEIVNLLDEAGKKTKEGRSNLNVYLSSFSDTILDLVPQILITRGSGAGLKGLGVKDKLAYTLGAGLAGYSQMKGATMAELLKVPGLTQDQREATSNSVALFTALVNNINPIEKRLATGQLSNSIKSYISKNAAKIARGDLKPSDFLFDLSKRIGVQGVVSGGSEFVEEGSEQVFRNNIVNPVLNEKYKTQLQEGTTAEEWKSLAIISFGVGSLTDIAGNIRFDKSPYQVEALRTVISDPDIYNSYIEGVRSSDPEIASNIDNVIRPIINEISSLGDIKDEAKTAIAINMLTASQLEQQISNIKNPQLKAKKQEELKNLYEKISQIELGEVDVTVEDKRPVNTKVEYMDTEVGTFQDNEEVTIGGNKYRFNRDSVTFIPENKDGSLGTLSIDNIVNQQLEIIQKPKTTEDAVQEQEAGQVPLQPGARGGQEVVQEVQAEPQVTAGADQTQEEIQKEIDDFISQEVTDAETTLALGDIESRMNNAEFIPIAEINQRADSLYKLWDKIDSNENLSPTQKESLKSKVENKIQKLEQYELATTDETGEVIETRTVKGPRVIGTKAKGIPSQFEVTPKRIADTKTTTVTNKDGESFSGTWSLLPNGTLQVTDQQGNVVPVTEGYSFVETIKDENGTVTGAVLEDTGTNTKFTVDDSDVALDMAIKAKEMALGPIEEGIFEEVVQQVVTMREPVLVSERAPQATKTAEPTPTTTTTEKVAPEAPQGPQIENFIQGFQTTKSNGQKSEASDYRKNPDTGKWTRVLPNGRTVPVNTPSIITELDNELSRLQDEEVAPQVTEEGGRKKEEKPTAEEAMAEARGAKVALTPELAPAIEAVSNFLKSAGIRVNVLSDAEFKEFAKSRGDMSGDEDGVFISDNNTGEIYINEAKVQNEWGKTIVFHEGIHPVMNIIKNTNPDLYANVLKGIRDEAKRNDGVAQAIAEVEASPGYQDKGQDVIDDEIIVETLARIADGKINLSKVKPTFKSRVIEFMNNIATKLGLPKIKVDSSDKQFRDFATKLSTALREGGSIEDIVGIDNIFNYQNNIPIPGVIAYGQMSSDIERISDKPVEIYLQKGVKKLSERSIKEIYDDYNGNVVVINSDPTRVGELTLQSGKKIFMYGGPTYLSIEDNVNGNIGFATTQIGKVNSWLKYVKQLFGDNNGVTLVATQAPSSLLSNSYSLRYVLDAISQLDAKILQSDEFKKEFFGKDLIKLKGAFGEQKYIEFINKYENSDLSDPQVFEDMISEMSYKIGDDNKPASFKARSAFLSNLLGGIVLKSKLKTVEGDKGYISKKPTKFIAKQLMDSFGINAEKVMREIGIPSVVDLYMNEGKWGFAVSGFESDPNISIESVQKSGITHPLFNAKFPGKNQFILDGLYEVDSLFTPIKMKGKKTETYIKRASQMLAGSMYVKGGTQPEDFEFTPVSPIQSSTAQLSQGIARGEIQTRVLPEGLEVTNGWYSPIEKRLRETKIDKQSANKWLTSGLIGKGDEAIYTGVKGWLEGKNPQEQVSKKEILDWMKDNRVEIVEVVKGGMSRKGMTAREAIQKLNDGYDVFYMEDDGGSEFQVYEIEDTGNQERNYYLDSDFDGAGDPTKYSKYQLDGDKSNYKEVLVTLPSKAPKLTFEKWAEEYYGDISDLTESQLKLAQDQYQRALKDDFTSKGNLATQKADFKSSHFDEPNILVHLRMNTRTDADGNKVLFLEEIQSDWGQEGKKKGFAPSFDLIEENGKFNIYSSVNNKKEPAFQFDNKSDAIKMLSTLNNINVDKLSPAPFVTDTNAWTKLGLKMALREAVAQGADKIAWTTGEQQNKRYDLSKQVDEITYKKLDNGDYRVVVYKDGNALQRQDLKEDKLESNFGKDVAERIINDKGDKNELTGINSLSGINLSVGGKGMKGFYDKIVPDVTKSLVKELTGREGVIGETTLLKDNTQQSIDITPELVSSVNRGMPQFSAGIKRESTNKANTASDALGDLIGKPKVQTSTLQDVESTAKALEMIDEETLENLTPFKDERVSHRITFDEESTTTLDDMTKGGELIPDDFYDKPNYYADTRDKATKESLFIIKKVKGNPNATVTIFRGIPKNGVKSIKNGDWVSLSREYASGEGDMVISMQVKASDVRWDANDVNEFAYFPKDPKIPNAKFISTAYHKAKKDGSNPELVKAVEDLLGGAQASQIQRGQFKGETKFNPKNRGSFDVRSFNRFVNSLTDYIRAKVDEDVYTQQDFIAEMESGVLGAPVIIDQVGADFLFNKANVVLDRGAPATMETATEGALKENGLNDKFIEAMGGIDGLLDYMQNKKIGKKDCK